MDRELDVRWRSKQSPFDGDIIYLNNYVPIGLLRTALMSLVTILQQHDHASSLYSFFDWHEHDGYIGSRQPTTWQSVKQLLDSDQSLYGARTGDSFVRLAFYPSDNSFLLRIYIMDENEEPEYPGRWGNFDLSGTPNLLTLVRTDLTESIQRILHQEESGSYFDQRYAG